MAYARVAVFSLAALRLLACPQALALATTKTKLHHRIRGYGDLTSVEATCQNLQDAYPDLTLFSDQSEYTTLNEGAYYPAHVCSLPLSHVERLGHLGVFKHTKIPSYYRGRSQEAHLILSLLVARRPARSLLHLHPQQRRPDGLWRPDAVHLRRTVRHPGRRPHDHRGRGQHRLVRDPALDRRAGRAVSLRRRVDGDRRLGQSVAERL